MYRRVVIACLIAVLGVAPMAAAKIPRPVPDFTFTMPGGGTMSLAQFHGKVIALEFILTTCPHCKRSISALQKLYGEYAEKGLQVLAVAINDGAENLIPAFAQETDCTFPIGYTHRDRAIDFLQHPVMLTMWMPQLVFISKDGNIVGQFQGTDPFFRKEEPNMRAWIEKLLAK